MVSALEDNMKDFPLPAVEVKRILFPQAELIGRRSLNSPCPGCGSRTVRSRDGRDMCLICGYLQTHA